jgi:hypothetical protein
MAMDPSFGLFKCCDCREGKDFSESNRRTSYLGQATDGVTEDIALFGVGIGFLPDKSAALVVSRLTPQGASEEDILAQILFVETTNSCFMPSLPYSS